MRTLLPPLKTAVLSICLIAGLSACRTGDQGTTASTEQRETSRPATDVTPPAVPLEQYAEGELQSVDLSGKTFALRDSDGKEQRFSYSDITRILGIPSAQGLTGKQGSRARVGYVLQATTNSAIWIEIVEPQAPTQK